MIRINEAIPKMLLDQIQAGQVVLFLGPGSNTGALHAHGKKFPSEVDLAKSIVERFLDKGFRGSSLAQVQELAVYSAGLFPVQNFLAESYSEFKPASYHKILPQLSWSAIFTTNYDQLIEQAYQSDSNRLQKLIVFTRNSDRIEDHIHSRSNLAFFKLHGSLSNVNDPTLPLILTSDQYQTHMNGRNLLFERLESYAYDHMLLFVCDDIGNPTARGILQRIASLQDARPRSYVVVPSITEAESNYWASKKIDCIKMSFEDFLNTVNNYIPKNTRSLSLFIDSSDHPIRRRFAVSNDIHLSESIINFLDNDADYLHKTFRAGSCDPKSFYKGYFPNWGPIEQNLDVKRAKLDDVLSEIFFAEDDLNSPSQQFFLIKGHAGSGKTVFSHRLAWDAANVLDKLCIYMKPAHRPTYEAISELFYLCKQRVFLFLDDSLEYIDDIKSLILKARKDRIALTIIGTARNSAWNDYGAELEPILSESYELHYLSEKEIIFLIGLLRQHNSLGYLEDLTLEEQKEALSRKAGRQLLVALHEATLGKPFTEIVQDEYRSISDPKAQSLYLTVCILHRLGIETRAGLIARIHAIPLTLFKENLFKPLESIVFAHETQYTRDYVYRSRHQHIAEIIFETVLTDQQDRYDEYIRLIEHLDIGYQTDRDALFGLISAKQLLRLFDDVDLVSSLYQHAQKRFSSEYYIYQQQAIFEMHRPEGSLEKAATLLRTAQELAPWNNTITHSLSELLLRKSNRSKVYIERKKFREESKHIALTLTEKDTTSHPHHTLIKISLDELEEIISEGDELSTTRKIRDVEKQIVDILQKFPGDQYILDAESRFRKLLDDHPRALAALQKAFQKNKKSAFIASRLSKMLEHKSSIDQAIQVLKECIDDNPYDKDLNYQLATLMINHDRGKSSEIIHHLRNAFTIGDTRHEAQFWYARSIYVEGNYSDALEIFKVLRDVDVDNRLKRSPRAKVMDGKVPARFGGTIIAKEQSFGFIRRERFGDKVFFGMSAEMENIPLQTNISFELAFNFFGPIAVSILLVN